MTLHVHKSLIIATMCFQGASGCVGSLAVASKIALISMYPENLTRSPKDTRQSVVNTRVRKMISDYAIFNLPQDCRTTVGIRPLYKDKNLNLTIYLLSFQMKLDSQLLLTLRS